jgi:hypothetical protein
MVDNHWVKPGDLIVASTPCALFNSYDELTDDEIVEVEPGDLGFVLATHTDWRLWLLVITNDRVGWTIAIQWKH